MGKIIKKADVYLDIEGDKICCTIEIPDNCHLIKDLNIIMQRLDRILLLHSINMMKLESIYFREEEIKE